MPAVAFWAAAWCAAGGSFWPPPYSPPSSPLYWSWAVISGSGLNPTEALPLSLTSGGALPPSRTALRISSLSARSTVTVTTAPSFSSFAFRPSARSLPWASSTFRFWSAFRTRSWPLANTTRMPLSGSTFLMVPTASRASTLPASVSSVTRANRQCRCMIVLLEQGDACRNTAVSLNTDPTSKLRRWRACRHRTPASGLEWLESSLVPQYLSNPP